MRGPSQAVEEPSGNSTGVHAYRIPITGAIDLFAGALGGGLAVLVCQPLDTIKVKMQTYPQFFTGAWDCGKKTWNTQGIKGLYAGTVPSLAANIAENASLFFFYGLCQRVVQNIVKVPRIEDLNSFQNATAGGGAAFFTSFFLCPTELLKCQLQAMAEARQIQLAENPNVKLEPRIGPWTLMRRILKQEGVIGMFRGLNSTFAREIPGYFFFFGGYDAARNVLAGKGSKDELGPVKTVLCGGFAGVSCWAAIFPADVVKSRLQTGRAHTGFFTTLITIAKTEGVLALYNGLTPTLIRTFPASGILFVVYEFTKSSLEKLVFGGK
ncbi:mitochondrial ornithine transporter 1-like [Paramacrobiotus metropolitanus]|uniref:mitochondrial ornithine transporter 1-like n=1 Tax=Paramacrobiotus metropolitanus TaxID=2943436 RepID=UPI002445A0A3|nr:mitochondrial ornithine transporter 1-like [Paramacrobiotus metropolitanus]